MAYMNILKFHSVQLPPMQCRLIVLSPEKTSFTCGDLINGELQISCQKDIYSFGIRVALEGTAMVKLKDRQGGIESKTASLLERMVYVFGKGDQKVRLSPGDHSFPFSLEIPYPPEGSFEGLAGSFKSLFGLILYQIVGYVQLEWKIIRKAEKTISMISYSNLSLIQNEPILYEKAEKGPYFFPSLISRKLVPQFRFRLKLPHSFYIGGDELYFDLELDNPLGVEIEFMSLSLVQKISYFAGSNCSKVKHKILGRKEKESSNVEGSSWKDKLHIPYGTRVTQKGIIEICYHVKIEVKTLKGHTAGLKGEVPIVIGTTRELLSLPEVKVEGGDEGPESQKLKVNDLKCRERSPSPCPLSRARSSGPFGRRSFPCSFMNKSLDSGDDSSFKGASSGGQAQGERRPPKYSALRSASVETLPPTYEDALDDPTHPHHQISKGSSEDSDSALEIQEFKKSAHEEEGNDAADEEEEEEEEESNDEESGEEDKQSG